MTVTMAHADWFPAQRWGRAVVAAVLLSAAFGSVGLVRNLLSEQPLPFIARPPVTVQYDAGAAGSPGVVAGTEVIRTVTLDQAAAMSFDPSVVFIDARDASEFAAGHIPGAVSLPYHDYDRVWPEVSPKLAPDNTIIAYCEGGGCESSIQIARRLTRAGYRSVLVFVGGWPAWRDAGFPTE
ncbi:MAG: rhodanese-like domain-containing protein [Acidobacteriota bacterium]